MEYLGSAVGGLGWRAVDFWQCTPVEFTAAVKGYNRANSSESDSGNSNSATHLEEMREMKSWLDTLPATIPR